MTRYYVKMTPELFNGIDPLRLPAGFQIERVVGSDPLYLHVEVEDSDAEAALEGKTIVPWFQTTVDGKTVITEREVMHLAHNQVHVEKPELETG